MKQANAYVNAKNILQKALMETQGYLRGNARKMRKGQFQQEKQKGILRKTIAIHHM